MLSKVICIEPIGNNRSNSPLAFNSKINRERNLSEQVHQGIILKYEIDMGGNPEIPKTFLKCCR